MKRLIVAGILTVGIHVLLFGMEFNWPGKKPLPRPKTRVMTMTLAYLQPKKPKSKPAIKKPDVTPKKNVFVKKKVEEPPFKEKEKEKKREHIPRLKPQKKPLKPVETVKISPPPMPAPEPEKVEIAEKPGYPGPDFAEEDNKSKELSKEVSMAVETTTELPDEPPVVQEIEQEAMPLYQINPPPKYPGIARKRGYQGTVVLEVMVDRNGKVGDLRVFMSSGYSILDKAAMNSVKGWSFKPGMRGDEKVEMWVRVPIRFQLK